MKPHDHKALKVITAEMDMTLQEIITTAVNDWLVKNGRQPVEEMPTRLEARQMRDKQ